MNKYETVLSSVVALVMAGVATFWSYVDPSHTIMHVWAFAIGYSVCVFASLLWRGWNSNL